MFHSRLFLIVGLALAVGVVGLNGCSSKKKVVIQPRQTKEPEKPAPVTQVKEAPKVEEKVKEPEKPKELRFTTIYFDFDKSDIRGDQRSGMVKNAQLLQENKTAKIRIEGHCDERGTNEYNLALGQRRADAVKTFLVDYGIDSARISTISYGEERPVDSGHNENAWAKNRRAEFFAISGNVSLNTR